MTTIWIVLALTIGAAAGFLLAACAMLLVKSIRKSTNSPARASAHASRTLEFMGY